MPFPPFCEVCDELMSWTKGGYLLFNEAKGNTYDPAIENHRFDKDGNMLDPYIDVYDKSVERYSFSENIPYRILEKGIDYGLCQ